MFNPADRTQGYKLWSHGFIEPIGTAPLPVQDPPFPDDWSVTNPVVDLQIINWAAPSGYTMTDDGEIRGFGAVIDPGVHGHLPTYDFRIWKWLFMNPNGDGSGYQFNFVGTYVRWGPTAPVLPIGFDGTVPDYHQDFVRDVALNWSNKKWVILGKTGQVDASFDVDSSAVPYNPIADAYRCLVVRDWTTTTPKVLVCHMSGWLYGCNGWGSFSGQPIEFAGRDIVRDMALINDGSGVDPMELAFASYSGGVYRWFVSDPPTALFNSPANGSTVTTTTRPVIDVAWNDPDGDAIVNVDVRIFGPNVASITNPQPLTGPVPVPRQAWSVDARTTGFVPTFDLENGTWQGFVRVRDAATDVSAWTKSTWTQNVTRPPTPTLAVLTVGHSNRLTVTGTTNATRFIFAEYTDNGTDWFPVRGANPGPSILSAGVQIFDYEAPFQQERTYRARVASVAPDLSSLWSSTATAEVHGTGWTLMRVSDHTELPLKVEPGFSKPDPSGTGKFVPLVGTESIVLDSGWREGDLQLKLRTLSKADRYALRDCIRSGQTFLLRNPHSDHWFVRFTDDPTRDFLRAVPLLEENTALRDANIFNVTLTVVRRPSA